MKIGKKQIILSALVLALGSAVYLNSQFSPGQKDAYDAPSSTFATKELGEAQFVNATPEDVATNEKPQEPPKTASEYFSRAKSERQKAHDEATDIIKEVLEDEKSTSEMKTEAIKQAAAISKNIEKEANIEGLIRAKGFEECIAFIQGDECSVVVSAGGLTEATAIAIREIIAGQGGISADKIRIIEAK